MRSPDQVLTAAEMRANVLKQASLARKTKGEFDRAVQLDPENVDAQYRTEFSVKALTDAGLQVKDIKVELGDSNFPFSGGSGGSTTAPAGSRLRPSRSS